MHFLVECENGCLFTAGIDLFAGMRLKDGRPWSTRLDGLKLETGSSIPSLTLGCPECGCEVTLGLAMFRITDEDGLTTSDLVGDRKFKVIDGDG